MPFSNRPPKETDFFIDVPDVGRFRFGRVTYGDHINIRAEHSRITGPNPAGDPELEGHGTIVSHYRVLMVQCPPGWEHLEAMDMNTAVNVEQQILDVHFAVREKLDSFRRPNNPEAGSQGAGAAGAPDDGLLVPPQVPAAAN